LAQEIGAEQTYFTHISHQLGLHEEVQSQLPENIYLAYDGLTIEIN
jgi:phosphoribosyl 1,2-cyclic phosphate phosphodiesterase